MESDQLGNINAMRPLIVAAVIFFVIAAISAFSASVNVHETGFIALGLAAFAGDQLGVNWSRPVARPVARRGFRRSL